MTRIFLIHILALLIPFSTQQYDFDFSQLEGNSLYTDIQNCANHKDLSTCPDVAMKSGYYQCCRFHTSIQVYNSYYRRYEDSVSQDICNVWVPFDYSDEQIESMQKSYQEAVTFLTLNYNYHIPIIQNTYTCPKKNVTFNIGKGSFTDEEIEIMKDENYCLRLYYEGLYQLGYISDIIGDSSDRTITKDICMKGRTLPSSGNSCAYASFHFKFSDGTTEDIATCVLVSSASYESKSLDKLLENDFKKFSSLDGQAVTSFDVEITNKDGNVLKYDSLTKTVVTEQNSSEKLEKSLLILFSLLIILL